MRLRIDLGYDGTRFHGWATQPGLRTVQETVELALATVFRLPEVPVTCAGRTDAGVHARGQVVHLDVPALPEVRRRRTRPAVEPAPDRSDELAGLVRRLNGILPADVRVRTAHPVPEGFDARFSAVWRRYAYRIADRPATVDPLVRGFVLDLPRELDDETMNRAARGLVGEHDFAAFCRKRVGATTVRTLLELGWHREPGGLLVAAVRADAFCHTMVRALIGCLVAVGEGRYPPEWPAEVLAAGVRDPRAGVLPAHGLTLEEVGYPPDNRLAAQARASRVVRSLPTG